MIGPVVKLNSGGGRGFIYINLIIVKSSTHLAVTSVHVSFKILFTISLEIEFNKI